MTTSRMEGFSDGVFAVAITLLSLDLMAPPFEHRHTLAHELLQHWPSYLAFVISFMTIGIIWINHHAALSRLRQPDHAILILNLQLLMSICAIPFATDLMADYLRHGRGADLAAAVYVGVLAWMGISFVALNWFMLFRRRALLKSTLTQGAQRLAIRRGAAGIVPYFAGIGLAFISPYISLAITGLVVLYYALPFAVGGSET